MIFDPKALAARILLAVAAHPGRVHTLAEVSASVGARRIDVRAMVTRLHHEGLVDAYRMRPTLEGFAIAAALRACAPRALRIGRAIAAA